MSLFEREKGPKTCKYLLSTKNLICWLHRRLPLNKLHELGIRLENEKENKNCLPRDSNPQNVSLSTDALVHYATQAI